MICHHRVEATRSRDGLARRQPTLRNRVIARGVERGQLLEHQRLALPDVDRQFLADIARFFDDLAPNFEKPPVEERLGSRYLGDVNIRLAGAHQQVDAVLADDLACQRLQMFVVEVAGRASHPR